MKFVKENVLDPIIEKGLEIAKNSPLVQSVIKVAVHVLILASYVLFPVTIPIRIAMHGIAYLFHD